MSNSKLNIPVAPPFSFDECLKFLGRSGNESLFLAESDRVIKAFETSNGDVLASIKFGNDSLVVEFLAGKPRKSDIEEIKKFISDWFDLENDILPFYKLASKDALLKPLVKQFHGLRMMGIPDLFEALSWAVIGQQINLAFAYTIKRRLVEAYGRSIEFNGNKHYIFPSPEVIANANVDDLKLLQFSQKKAEYLIGIAQKFVSGELDKEQLLKINNKLEVEEKLTSVRGIGKWTAHYVMMKSLKDYSAFPVGDVGLQNAIKHLLSLPAKPTPAEVEKIGASWKGWEAYATFYLWRSLY